jgi:hypothetical protein
MAVSPGAEERLLGAAEIVDGELPELLPPPHPTRTVALVTNAMIKACDLMASPLLV